MFLGNSENMRLCLCIKKQEHSKSKIIFNETEAARLAKRCFVRIQFHKFYSFWEKELPFSFKLKSK